jgi:hypothetical protein
MCCTTATSGTHGAPWTCATGNEFGAPRVGFFLVVEVHMDGTKCYMLIYNSTVHKKAIPINIELYVKEHIAAWTKHCITSCTMYVEIMT